MTYSKTEISLGIAATWQTPVCLDITDTWQTRVVLGTWWVQGQSAKYEYLSCYSLLSDDLKAENNWKAKLFNLVFYQLSSQTKEKKRYIIWKTCKLADPLPVCSLFAEKYGKMTKFTFSSPPQLSTQWLEKYVFRTTKPIDFSSRNNFWMFSLFRMFFLAFSVYYCKKICRQLYYPTKT